MIEEYLERRKKIAVIGLGYVGLPLLLSFEKFFSMVGFDISGDKIQKRRVGIDETL